jgi:hypothetical protein
MSCVPASPTTRSHRDRQDQRRAHVGAHGLRIVRLRPPRSGRFRRERLRRGSRRGQVSRPCSSRRGRRGRGRRACGRRSGGGRTGAIGRRSSPISWDRTVNHVRGPHKRAGSRVDTVLLSPSRPLGGAPWRLRPASWRCCGITSQRRALRCQTRKRCCSRRRAAASCAIQLGAPKLVPRGGGRRRGPDGRGRAIGP